MRAKSKLNDTIEIRVSTLEKNRLKGLAKLYAGGNLSLWLVYAGLNVERKNLKETDLWDSARRLKRKKS